MIEQFLVGEIFTFLMIFVRVGSGIMLMPGIGEGYVSMRARLIVALSVSLAMTPALSGFMPAVPTSPLHLGGLIATEIIIGGFFGFMARILISAMHTVGMIISYQSSLAAATMFDMTQAGQGSGIGNFLSVLSVVLLFAMDLHHIMLAGLYDSYTLFPIDGKLPTGDMTEVISKLVSDVFLTAVKLSSPAIILGLTIYMGSGVLSRLMPNMHVFFVVIPPQIVLSFMVLTMTLSGMLLWYMEYIENYLMQYVR